MAIEFYSISVYVQREFEGRPLRTPLLELSLVLFGIAEVYQLPQCAQER